MKIDLAEMAGAVQQAYRVAATEQVGEGPTFLGLAHGLRVKDICLTLAQGTSANVDSLTIASLWHEAGRAFGTEDYLGISAALAVTHLKALSAEQSLILACHRLGTVVMWSRLEMQFRATLSVSHNVLCGIASCRLFRCPQPSPANSSICRPANCA